MFFSPHIIFHNIGLYSNMDNRHDFVLGTFEYIEADGEICRKCITKCIQYSTTRPVWFFDYFTYSTIICRSNFYSWHWLHNHLPWSSHTKLMRSLQMNLVFLSFEIWDKCSTSCTLLNDAGWCLLLVRVPVKCRNCEWPVSHLAVFAALGNAVNYSIKEPHWPTVCFFLPWCTSCTFDHDCPHHLFPGCKMRLFLLFRYPRLFFRNA